MLTSKQRAKLKGLATNIEPIFQLGKNEISKNQLDGIMEALNKRELVKISVLKTSANPAEESASQIAKKLRAEVVAVIGNKIVLYRRSDDKNAVHIEF